MSHLVPFVNFLPLSEEMKCVLVTLQSHINSIGKTVKILQYEEHLHFLHIFFSNSFSNITDL